MGVTGEEFDFQAWKGGAPVDATHKADASLCSSFYKNDNPIWQWYATDCDGSDKDNIPYCEKEVEGVEGGTWPADEPCYAQVDRKAFGSDVVKPVTTADAKECAALCDETDGCEFWNWYDERAVKSFRRKCALKHQFRKIHNQKKATTGRKNCDVPVPGGKDPVDPVPVDPVPVVDPTANCPATSDKCVTGKFRLEGKGSNSKKGRVEYCGSKCKWGTVCDDGFKQDEGDMVCKELGFTRATKIYGDHVKGKSNIPDKHPYGRGVGKPVLIDDLRCPKGASSLSQCTYKPNINVNCLHYEDTAVICA